MTRTKLTSQLLLFMLFSGTSSNYVRAAWNRAKRHMRLTSRGLVTPALCHRPGVSKLRPRAKCGPRSHFIRPAKPFCH